MKESSVHQLSLAVPLMLAGLVTPLVLGNFRSPDWVRTIVTLIFYSGIAAEALKFQCSYLVRAECRNWRNSFRSSLQRCRSVKNATVTVG
jgi:hypothetical protein